MGFVYTLQARECPHCGDTYTNYPAVSRVTGEDICPICGIREALDSIGVESREEQDHIIKLAKDYERKTRGKIK